MNENQEKRLMEAFNQYESGTSLATLQGIFPEVAVELDQMVEAERLLKEGKELMRLDQGVARKVVAALTERAKQNQSSIFMSSLWRLAAPVGVAALALIFVLANQHATEPTLVVNEHADLSEQSAGEAGTMAAPTVEPMMAKNAAVSLMSAPPEQDAMERAQAPEPQPAAAQNDTLYLWQMNALALLAILCAVVFFKHRQARRR